MADFDGLIRQALASQNAADPATRERIYQSSRRALAKMLEKAETLSDDAIRQHFASLENSISLIEADYAPPPSPPQTPQPVSPPSSPRPTFPPAGPVKQNSDPIRADSLNSSVDERPQIRPAQSPQFPGPAPAPRPSPLQTRPQSSSGMENPRPQPEPARPAPAQPVLRREPDFEPEHEPWQQSEPENVEAYLGEIAPETEMRANPSSQYQGDEDFAADPPPTYRRKNPLVRRIWPIFLALAVIAVILWLLYALLAIMPGDSANNSNADEPGPVGQSEQSEDGSILITLLEPTDLSALSTAGRGSAELITEQKRPVLRLQSLRQGGLSEVSAEPILLELEKGVLQQVSGKEVTVEFLAKSGTSGPAQFSVECDIAGDSVCGRKRFRVGLQPERIVFSLGIRSDLPSDAKAYLAINTDITNAANATGEGDLIDIVYVRLRIAPPA